LARFAILGLGVGAIYGLSAQGLVLIFLGNKVLNFSHGAISLVAACVYYECAAVGAPLWTAALTALLVATALGALIELLIMYPLRRASAVTRLVATIGLLTVIQSAAALRYGDATKFVGSLLPEVSWRIGDHLVIGSDRALLFLIGVGLTIALTLLHRQTRFGMATTAVAESPRAAEVLGWSSRAISLVNWMLGALLAGVAGVLIAPINGVNVASLSTLIYGALAAALIGGFRSFAWAMAGGVLLGIAQAETVRIGGEVGWSTAIPFVVIVLVSFFRKQKISVRGEIPPNLPGIGNGNISVLSIVILFILFSAVLIAASDNIIDAVTTSLISAILGLSVVVITGYAGQMSLASFAIAGVGALVAARTASELHANFLLSIVAGAVSGALLGGLFALVAQRVRSDTVAIVTMGAALALESLVLANPWFTGGVSGLLVPAPNAFGIDLDSVSHPGRFAVLCGLVILACGLATSNLRRGITGRRLLAIRSSERAASTLGISVQTAKLAAHGTAGCLAGLAGALQAFSHPRLVFGDYTIDASLALLVAVILGGAGYIGSAIMAGFALSGGLVFYLLSLTGWQRYLPLAMGLLLLINLTLVPDGVMAQNARIIGAFSGRWRRSAKVMHSPIADSESPAELENVTEGTLEIRNVSVRFGGVAALDRVDMSMSQGHVEGLIGPNGAGKTSFIDAVTGLSRLDEGDILFRGASFKSFSASVRARRGLGRTLQGLELFDELTVEENLVIGSQAHLPWSYARDILFPERSKISPRGRMAVQRFGLEAVLGDRPRDLPYGKRRLVAIARAIAAEPSLLLLDEPAAGLSANERDELAKLIRELAEDWGMGVLIVEHDVELVMRVCDHITVLEFGKVIARGSPADIRKDARVLQAFLGEAEAEVATA
jgi:sulfate-transporting ATPase